MRPRWHVDSDLMKRWIDGQLQLEQPDNLPRKVQHASILAMAGRFEQAHEKFEEVLTYIPDNARFDQLRPLSALRWAR